MPFKSFDELRAACTNLWPGDEAAARPRSPARTR